MTVATKEFEMTVGGPFPAKSVEQSPAVVRVVGAAIGAINNAKTAFADGKIDQAEAAEIFQLVCTGFVEWLVRVTPLIEDRDLVADLERQRCAVGSCEEHLAECRILADASLIVRKLAEAAGTLKPVAGSRLATDRPDTERTGRV